MMKKIKNFYIIITCMIVSAVLLTLQIITGKLPFSANPYNSYYLQAESWLRGHLDLGKDYPHLELAIYGGKYYVSFPPFPSYVMLPFAIFGFSSCDWIITIISSVLGVAYSIGIMRHFGKTKKQCIFWGLFITIGSNWLFTSFVPWVWFIAQNLAFTLSVMAIYYALKGKAGLSLSFWACSVGCRPFQAIYGIVLLYLLYDGFREKNTDFTAWDMIRNKWYCVIVPFAIALSYMILNFARFKNILEFGHNYLPEFTRIETGQFNTAYLQENIIHLLRLPKINGRMIQFQSSDGFCIFIASPIFMLYLIYFIRSLCDETEKKKGFICFAFALFILHLFMITLHKTMGGSHYGNRYTNDTLPFVYLLLAYMLPLNIKYTKLNIIMFFAGFMLNCIWSYMYYT